MLIDVIIPAAGCGQRMGSRGPKGLISLGSQTVLQRQIQQLKFVFPGCRVVVVGGHKHDKLYKSLPKGTTFVLNTEHADTNVSKSIEVGFQYTKADVPALIVYGDLVFNYAALLGIKPDESSVVVEDTSTREDEVGVSVVDGMAGQFAFGMTPRWAHIAMMMPREKELFVKASLPAHRFRYFGYEILNEVIKDGGSFKVIKPDSMRLVEIDSAKDIDKAVELARENPL